MPPTYLPSSQSPLQGGRGGPGKPLFGVQFWGQKKRKKAKIAKTPSPSGDAKGPWGEGVVVRRTNPPYPPPGSELKKKPESLDKGGGRYPPTDTGFLVDIVEKVSKNKLQTADLTRSASLRCNAPAFNEVVVDGGAQRCPATPPLSPLPLNGFHHKHRDTPSASAFRPHVGPISVLAPAHRWPAPRSSTRRWRPPR